jgi:hypothetical protein
LVGPSVGWLVVWLVGCLVGWLFGWLVCHFTTVYAFSQTVFTWTWPADQYPHPEFRSRLFPILFRSLLHYVSQTTRTTKSVTLS